MANNIGISGVLYGTASSGDGSLQIQPGYGPYASLEEAFGTNGIGKNTQEIYKPQPRPGLKFMIRTSNNGVVSADEYIYLGGTIDTTTRVITNPRYIKLNRQLKSETALNKAAGEVNTTSSKVYPIVTDSEGNLAVVVPWTDTLPSAATATQLGSIKVKSVTNTSQTVNTPSTTSGKYYGIQVDKDGLAFVNVPWTDTNSTTLDISVGNSSKTVSSTSAKNVTLIQGDNIVLEANESIQTVTISSTLPSEFIAVYEDGLYNILQFQYLAHF